MPSSEATKGRPSIFAVAKGTGGGASIMLDVYIDTVSLVSYENETGLQDKVLDGNIYGRGSYDMKSGEAALGSRPELGIDDADFKFEARMLFSRATFAVDSKDLIVSLLANNFKENAGGDAT